MAARSSKRRSSGRSGRTSGGTRARSSSAGRSSRGGRKRTTSGEAGRSSRGGGRPRTSRSTAGRARRSSRSTGAGSTRRTAKLDPLAMLIRDHREVDRLLQQFEASKDAGKKKALFEKVRSELELHPRLEEEVFYPEAEQRQELKDLIGEAHGEHDKVKQMLREAEGQDADSGEFDATVAGIKGAVEHHVREEEEEIFPVVEKTFSPDHMRELGERMQSRRAELQRGNSGMGEGRRGLVGRLMGR